jgi:hypothetical protein
MNGSRSSLLKSGAMVLCVYASAIQSNAQLDPAKHRGEQASFSVEFAFEHPLALNEAAKKALATSPALADDLKRKNLAPKDLPDGWFTASRIHLGVGVAGLVVMGPIANNAPFWVLRQTASGYDLVLDTTGSDLKLLKTRTNGLRDIKASALVGVAHWGSLEFQFDGHNYRLAKRAGGSIGAKVPRDLADYATHAPFVQPADNDAGQVLAQARTWIWEQWKAHKRFYVTVSAQDDDGNQETYHLYTSSAPAYPGLILKIHKTEWEKDSPVESRRNITEDDLWVASDLERVYAAEDEDHEPQVIPNEKSVSASVYRLGFREDAFWLATL